MSCDESGIWLVESLAEEVFQWKCIKSNNMHLLATINTLFVTKHTCIGLLRRLRYQFLEAADGLKEEIRIMCLRSELMLHQLLLYYYNKSLY